MSKNKNQSGSLLYALVGFEKKRDRKQAILIILLHVLAWCVFFLLPLLFYPVRFENSNFFIAGLTSKIFLIGLFYFNYYFLLPRFFERKKFASYFLIVLLIIVAAIIQDIAIHNRVAWQARYRINRLHTGSNHHFTDSASVAGFPSPGNPILRDSTFMFPPQETFIMGMPRDFVMIAISKTSSLCFLLLLVGGLVRLGSLFINNQHEKKILENANLNAEVNFLKSQINPHFLFNTLNGIYSQAHERSEKTELSILKLSDLLRYMLYDAGHEKTELSKDIQYISNYIDLQRLRLSSKITIDYKVEGKTDGHYIAPLLLIPFIENAFKHGISYTNPSVIKIHIRFFEETLTLHVENPLVENNSFTAGGLGLKNVSRRLELLYPGRYLLDIGTTEKLHIANLKIVLSD